MAWLILPAPGGLPVSLPPLAVDVDGTLTDQDHALDHRVLPVLREWAAEAPVVVATGKSLPYPIGLCEFLAIPRRVVAENGGAVYVEREAQGDGELLFQGDREAARAVAREYESAGYEIGWGAVDFVNRWRETEFAVSIDSPLAPLREIAAEHGLEVVDTGYAYHVKSPGVDKGDGVETAAAALGHEPAEFVAIGDSENDAEAFATAGRSFAVANADETALAAADTVCEAAYADGFLEAVERVRSEFD